MPPYQVKRVLDVSEQRYESPQQHGDAHTEKDPFGSLCKVRVHKVDGVGYGCALGREQHVELILKHGLHTEAASDGKDKCERGYYGKQGAVCHCAGLCLYVAVQK